MATHSSILAWRIPWTEESGGLQSMESQRVGRNGSNLAHTHNLHYSHTSKYIYIYAHGSILYNSEKLKTT